MSVMLGLGWGKYEDHAGLGLGSKWGVGGVRQQWVKGVVGFGVGARGEDVGKSKDRGG